MPSPESPLRREETPGTPREEAPKLRLVKPARAVELTALEREFLPPLLAIQETPPSPVQRWVLWTIIALIIALIVWASIGKISIVATATGKFVPQGRVKEVQPLASSIVKAIDVREGEHVHKGDLLLELDPTLSAADLAADKDKYEFNRLEQMRLRSELTHKRAEYAAAGQPVGLMALEQQMRTAREQAYASKLAEAHSTVDEKNAALEAAQAMLNKYRETTEIASERESSARPLLSTGAISRVDYLRLKEDLVQNRNDLVAQGHTVAQAQAALAEATRAVGEVERDHVADLYKDLDREVSSEPALKGDFAKSKQIYALQWLRSPVDGLVQKVAVSTIGQVVTPAQSLVTIVPDGAPLLVEATVSNQDIGYLKLGQKVAVKVDTFPFEKYGTIPGTLVWISPDAEDQSATSPDTDTRTGVPTNRERPPIGRLNAGYVYKVHIRTQPATFIVDGARRKVLAGMTVQADITTDRRSVISFFLSPVVKYLNEGLQVR